MLATRILSDSNTLAAKMRSDSLALAGIVSGDSLLLGNRISALEDKSHSDSLSLATKMHNDSNLLATRILSDSNTFTLKMRGDSVALAGIIRTDSNTLTTKMRSDSVSLAMRIHTDSNTLAMKMRSDSNTLANKIYADSLYLHDSIDNLARSMNLKRVLLGDNKAGGMRIMDLANPQVSTDAATLSVVNDSAANLRTVLSTVDAKFDNKLNNAATDTLVSRVSLDSVKVNIRSAAVAGLSGKLNNNALDTLISTRRVHDSLEARFASGFNINRILNFGNDAKGKRIIGLSNPTYDNLSAAATLSVVVDSASNLRSTLSVIDTKVDNKLNNDAIDSLVSQDNLDSVKINIRTEIATGLSVKLNSEATDSLVSRGNLDSVKNNIRTAMSSGLDSKVNNDALDSLISIRRVNDTASTLRILISSVSSSVSNSWRDSVRAVDAAWRDSVRVVDASWHKAVKDTVKHLIDSINSVDDSWRDSVRVVDAAWRDSVRMVDAAWHKAVKDTVKHLIDSIKSVDNYWRDSIRTVSDNYESVIAMLESRITTVAQAVLSDKGTVGGEFSINATGDKVKFSQGNLQYQASTGIWSFAANQYDYQGYSNDDVAGDYAGWIDLYGWGTSGYDNTTKDANAINFQPYSTSKTVISDSYNKYGYGPSVNMRDPSLTGTSAKYDWGVFNAISNGGNFAGLWRTLTQEEWDYLLNTRSGAAFGGASNVRFLKATVMGTKGIVLIPDNFANDLPFISYDTHVNDASDNFSTEISSSSTWSEFENAGAVFLPITGSRSGSAYNSDNKGYYWTASYNSTSKASAYYVEFSSADLSIKTIGRQMGCAVRLVQDVK